MKKILFAALAVSMLGGGISSAYADNGGGGSTADLSGTGSMSIKAGYRPGCSINFDSSNYDLGTFSNGMSAFPSGGLVGKVTYTCSGGQVDSSRGITLAMEGTNSDGSDVSQRNLYAVNRSDPSVTPKIPVNIYIGASPSGTIWGGNLSGGPSKDGSQPIIPVQGVTTYPFTIQVPPIPGFNGGGQPTDYVNTFVAQIAYAPVKNP